jgi:hypothetical protein
VKTYFENKCHSEVVAEECNLRADELVVDHLKVDDERAYEEMVTVSSYSNLMFHIHLVEGLEQGINHHE